VLLFISWSFNYCFAWKWILVMIRIEFGSIFLNIHTYFKIIWLKILLYLQKKRELKLIWVVRKHQKLYWKKEISNRKCVYAFLGSRLEKIFFFEHQFLGSMWTWDQFRPKKMSNMSTRFFGPPLQWRKVLHFLNFTHHQNKIQCRCHF